MIGDIKTRALELRQVENDIAIRIQHRPGPGRHHAGGIVLLDDAWPFAKRGEIGPTEHGRLTPADLWAKICLAWRQAMSAIVISRQRRSMRNVLRAWGDGHPSVRAGRPGDGPHHEGKMSCLMGPWRHQWLVTSSRDPTGG